MNESLIKYLAGLLDADGSLSFNFRDDRSKSGRVFVGLRLNLAASDAVDPKGFVESLPVLTGMGSTSRYGERRQFITWYVTKRADVEMLLPRLIKHMVIKGEHWQWCLDTWRELRSKDRTISADERLALAEAAKQSRRSRVGPLKPKNHPTWAWAAGYLDGDGSYSCRRYFAKTNGYWQWSIHVSAVAHVADAAVLEFLQKAFGGNISDQSETVKVWRRSLGYQNRAFALRFLPKLAKHSRLKREKIDAIIHHHRQRLSVPGTEIRFCEVDGCEARRHGNGLCSKHYQRERKSVQATV